MDSPARYAHGGMDDVDKARDYLNFLKEVPDELQR